MAKVHSFEVVVDPDPDAGTRQALTATGTDELPADEGVALPEAATAALEAWIEASQLPVDTERVDGRLRVSSKSRDALSECQALIALHDQGLALRFTDHR